MKVESITLRNFKRFDQECTIEIKDRALNEVADRFLILGDNGTGKTTVLQAIALALSLASWRTRTVEDFDWTGWVPGRYERGGKPFLELLVRFSDEEIEATHRAAERWWKAEGESRTDGPYRAPGSSREVVLRLEGHHYYTPNDPSELYQFRGRHYATRLLATDYTARDLFEDLPGVFWFDQFRNLASSPVRGPGTSAGQESKEPETQGRMSFAVGIARLRGHLTGWQLERLLKGDKGREHDYLLEVENLYKRAFPGRSFSTPEPIYSREAPSPENYYFMLSDGRGVYDIEEMSAGEQSIFPILYRFVQMRIRHSVVLIDEIDLNLHPPLAQNFLRLLPHLGVDNQFIYTTHSRDISEVTNRDTIQRLEGGGLCL